MSFHFPYDLRMEIPFVATNDPQVFTAGFTLYVKQSDQTLRMIIGDSESEIILAAQADVTAALALKAPLDSPALTGVPTAPTAFAGTNTTQIATTAFVFAGLALKAPLASPALTGVPTAPTASPTSANTQIATTNFVATAIANLIASAPGALDTLKELADALGDDADFAGTVTTLLAGKLAKASNLSDLTDAAAARTNLGLANVAYQNLQNTFSEPTIFDTAFGGTPVVSVLAESTSGTGLQVASGVDEYAGILFHVVDSETATDLFRIDGGGPDDPFTISAFVEFGMHDNKIVGLADPTNAQDAVNKRHLESVSALKGGNNAFTGTNSFVHGATAGTPIVEVGTTSATTPAFQVTINTGAADYEVNAFAVVDTLDGTVVFSVTGNGDGTYYAGFSDDANARFRGLAAPTLSTDAANKGYVDGAISALALGSASTHAASDFQPALGFTAENVANKSTDIDADTGSDTKFPSVKAVEDYVAGHSGGGSGLTSWQVSVQLFRDQSDTTFSATPATLDITDGTVPNDGDTFHIEVDSGAFTDFEFDNNSSLNNGGYTPIDISGAASASDMMTLLAAAIGTMGGAVSVTNNGTTLTITTTATGSSRSITLSGFYSGTSGGSDGGGTSPANSDRLVQIKAAESGKRHFIRSVCVSEDSGQIWNNEIAIGYGTDPDSDFDLATHAVRAAGANDFIDSTQNEFHSGTQAAAVLYGYPDANTTLAAVRLGGAAGEAVDGGLTQSVTIIVSGYTA